MLDLSECFRTATWRREQHQAVALVYAITRATQMRARANDLFLLAALCVAAGYGGWPARACQRSHRQCAPGGSHHGHV